MASSTTTDDQVARLVRRTTCRDHPEPDPVRDDHKGDAVLRCATCDRILLRL